MRHSVRLALSIVFMLFSGRVRGQSTPQQPELKTAGSVPVKYYVSLPEGWSAAKSWPILVTLDGSSHQFLSNCQGFIQAREKRPFIIVTPWLSSNGNDPADGPALLAIVKEVQEERHGQSKFFLTGFSAGGHLMWQLVFSHPELLAGVAPAAANFRNRGIAAISKAPERARLPIHSFQGDMDPALTALNEQWADAVRLARENGYASFERTTVAGSGHSAFARQVIDYFSTLLKH